MRAQVIDCRAWWSLLGLALCAAVVLAGCEKTPQAEAEPSAETSQSDSPQQAAASGDSAYFADNVLEAWEQAGAEAGWIVHNDDGQFAFRDDRPDRVFASLKALGSVPG